MELEQARKLIGICINACLYSEGVVDEKPEPINATLPELLEANRLVKEANEAAMEKQRKEGGNCSHQMTISDRGIAAIYAAANFVGGSPEKPNILAYANGNYIIVIHERYMKREEDDEKENEPA